MECEPGYFCIDGARLPCPAGSYGSSLGLSSPSCSGPCPAGYYCGEGLAKADLGRRCGGPQWYCPEGSGAPFEVGIGNYTVGEPPDRRAAQVTMSCLDVNGFLIHGVLQLFPMR